MSRAPTGEQLLATNLKHDSKTTSCKFALLRALNDVVLGHPDLALTGELPVAVPLARLAEWWLAYTEYDLPSEFYNSHCIFPSQLFTSGGTLRWSGKSGQNRVLPFDGHE